MSNFSSAHICIQWDSHTLKKLPHAHIKEAEQKGFGWESIYLEASDLELTTPRDTEAEVAQVFDQLEDQFFWAHLGPEAVASLHFFIIYWEALN